MVMHARKPQRINDGYFEKHQTHPYQNSKYGSSKGGYGTSGERFERIRDSPNGNSYRSDSPDSQSPRDRDRGCQSKGSYLQKIREKERENRDYAKMSREKYSDHARSPKEKRGGGGSGGGRDSEHRTNHDRSCSSDDKLMSHSFKGSQNSSRDRKPMHNCQDKRDERDRVARVGDWSEHISSSGKKYYYNCKTEVSQWEKPREWVERERDRFRGKERDADRGYGGGSSGRASAHDKHSNSRGGGRESSKSSSGGSSRHWGREDNDAVVASGASQDPRRKHVADVDGPASGGPVPIQQQSTQDMDISPGDSTPTSEVSYGHTPSTSQQLGACVAAGPDTSLEPVAVGPVLLGAALPRLASHNSTPPATGSQRASGPAAAIAPAASPQGQSTPSMVPPPASVTTCNAPGPPVTLASLPRLLSQMSGGGAPGPSPKPLDQACDMNQKALQTIQTALILSRQATPSDGGAGGAHPDHTSSGGEGPPTPTHSENQDCMDTRKPLVVVATTATAVVVGSPPSSLSSLQSVASSLSALRPQGPSITPSLANYYRDDLVNHVRGWPADILEKQAQKLSEESHIMGSLQCTKVSAELKSARSIVRLTEIQATLQEQRILFLRQQIKTLEDMKAQNSFMSDDL